MKKLFFLSTLLATLHILFSSFALPTYEAEEANAIAGEWYTSSRNYIVTIYEENGLYKGKISWLAEPNNEDGQVKRDLHNPDESKRDQTITGVHLIYDFQYDGNGTWRSGTVYDPRSGKEYSGKITLKDNNTLSLRAYIGTPFLGKTVYWDRK